MICINFNVFFLHNWLDLDLVHFTKEQEKNHYWKSKLLKRSLSLNAPVTIQLNRFKRELLLSITWTSQENSECVCFKAVSYLSKASVVAKRLTKRKDEKRSTSRSDSGKVMVTSQQSRGGWSCTKLRREQLTSWSLEFKVGEIPWTYTTLAPPSFQFKRTMVQKN